LLARKGYARLLAILILACLILTWILRQADLTVELPELLPSSPSVTVEEGLVPPVALETADFEDFLAPGTILLQKFVADLDKDGGSEVVLVFGSVDDRQDPEAGGIAIVAGEGRDHRKAWEMRPSSDGQIVDAVIRDINKDGILEVLLFKRTEDGTGHYLHVFAWDGTKYTSLGPRGAVPPPEGAFTSAYYPPQVRNVDLTDSEEIVVFEDEASSERLKTIVYQWDGDAYARVDWIVVLGPLRPAEGKH
jgi:hypothetical protein